MPQTLLHEIAQLKRVVLRPLVAFFVLACLFVGVPLPRVGLVSQWAIMRIEHDLVPQGVSIVSLTPLDPFIAQMTVAALLAFFLSTPLFAYEVWRYIAPGLYPRERRGLAVFLISSFILLGLGAAFAYLCLIPLVFKGLYAFSVSGTTAFYSLRDLISLVSSMIAAVAVLFLLPIAMVMLSLVGLVKPLFWRRYTRHAVLLALVVSAIITPDGTGISMALLTLPICLLYAGGYVGSVAVARGRQKRRESGAIIQNSNQ